MLVDASVARSFVVVGWSVHLLAVGPSELHRIRDALDREGRDAGLSTGLASRALAAVYGLDRLLAMGPDQLVVVSLEPQEFDLAVRLQSRDPADHAWRRSLGARARRLDAGEAASIAIASQRSRSFASDDEDALVLWMALSGSTGWRTRDLLKWLANCGGVTEDEARSVYEMLQSDDLHRLGGPPW